MNRSNPEIILRDLPSLGDEIQRTSTPPVVSTSTTHKHQPINVFRSRKTKSIGGRGKRRRSSHLIIKSYTTKELEYQYNKLAGLGAKT